MNGPAHLILGWDGLPSRRFEFPPYTNSVVRGFGRDRDGVFKQEAWSADEIAEWTKKHARHEKFQRRTGFLHHLGPVGRAALRLMPTPARPGPWQYIQFTDCQVNHLTAIGGRGMSITNIAITTPARTVRIGQ